MQIKTGVSFSLDPISRLRLQLFAFKLLIVVPFSAVFASHRSYPLLATMSFFFFWNGVFAAVPALFQAQKVNAAFLTAWDEMAAFFGLAALMSIFNAIIG
jgi:hypothetical protein